MFLKGVVIDKFELCPEEAMHHRRTWRLLQPGAPFRTELEKATGPARKEPKRQRDQT